MFAQSATHTIVLIDDERDTLILISRTLMRAGYRVKAYSNPLVVLEACQRRELEFDLLLTDLDLRSESSLTGSGVIAELRKNGFTQPMILWSGGDDIHDLSPGEGGPDLIMSKGGALALITNIRQLLKQT
ncbi:response regulator [Patescibacteria group bacterium]|nr:response regulator [Patescibacteria group bacterium]MBU1028629.1 response regulator [Patescibacteria group bacterium]MBU1916295.1 response regulator [Patescibacteria group bacterium]